MLRFITAISKLKSFASDFGWKLAILHFAAKYRGLQKEVYVTTGHIAMTLRLGSSDFDVYRDTIIKGEYESLRILAPHTIIDVGANIGASSLSLSTKYPDATIIAIEPEDSNFNLMKKNCGHNNKIIPIKAALWSKSGNRTLLNRQTGHWGFTVAENIEGASNEHEQVICITIPEILATYDIARIGLMKLDIEGGEKAILESSDLWIEKVDCIVAELHDRIVPGSERAFYLSTAAFGTVFRSGEKVFAIR